MPVEAVSTVKITDNRTMEAGANKVEPKTEPYPKDSVELSDKKKDKPKKLKNTLISAGSVFVALAGMSLFILKYQGNRVKKLYDEKLVIKNLKEQIDFTEAKTVEEGIRFAKEVLGIKEVDKDITLEAINYANKGLVDVSNANKGRVFMPNALRFLTPRQEENYVAAVEMDINSNEFANLYINKQYFDLKFLDKKLKNFMFKKDNKPLFVFEEGLKPVYVPIWDKYIYASPNKDVAKLIDKYYKNPSSLTVEQKRNLYYSFTNSRDKAQRTFRNPVEALKRIERNNKDFIRNENITIDYASLEKMEHKEQHKFLLDILEKMKKQNIYLVKQISLINPLETIYHEAGHLQDMAKNLKELDLKQWKFDWKAEWEIIRNKNKNGDVNVSRAGVDEVDNRWGSIWKERYSELLERSPDVFKKRYPDLYEFLHDKNIQQASGKVSSYAQSGIGEFIAETYAQMMAHKKIPDDVLALYRRYKGPELLQ